MKNRIRNTLAVNHRLTLIAPCLAMMFVVSGCVYRINIQQGNLLDADVVEQIEVGMTRTQVRFLLGTPLVNNPFDEDRWDYFYYFKTGKTELVTSQHIIVFFHGDTVSKIDKSANQPETRESPGY